MRRGALRHLLVRPLAIILAAIFAPAAVILVLNLGARRPAAGLTLACWICATAGGFCGATISEAARSSFAWVLPGLRRSLLAAFAAAGIVTTALVGIVVAVSGASVTHPFVLAAWGFSAFSLGGALCLGPEALVLLPVAWVLYFVAISARLSWPSAMLAMPFMTGTAALVAAAPVLWWAFSRRTFRWAALTGPRVDGRSVWQESETLPWWPGTSRGVRRGAAPAVARVPYVGTSIVRGVVSTFRATSPRTAWLAGFALAGLCFVSLGPATLESVRYRPVSGLWVILAIPGWMIVSASRRPPSRATLPWPRRHHLAVAFGRDLLTTLAFPLVIAPAIAVAGLSVDGAVSGAVYRGIAVVAVFSPAIQWLSGPPAGGRWPNLAVTAVLGFVVLLAFVVALNLVVSGLPAVVESARAQAIMLGLLVVGSQALNWRSLKRYFARHDLVGGT